MREDTFDSVGFIEVVDEEFETGLDHLASGEELGVAHQSGNILIGELREDADGLGVSEKHPKMIINPIISKCFSFLMLYISNELSGLIS